MSETQLEQVREQTADPMLRWRIPDDETVVGVWQVNGSVMVALDRDVRHPERGPWLLALGSSEGFDGLFDQAADRLGRPPGAVTVEAPAFGLIPADWRLEVRGRWDYMACALPPAGPDDSRVAEVDDPATITAVLESGYPETWARPGDPAVLCWIGGYDEGRPASIGALARTVNGGAHLRAITTVPESTGKGLATAVTAALTRRGFAEISDEVTLGVFTANDRAIALYERLGYRRVHRFISAVAAHS